MSDRTTPKPPSQIDPASPEPEELLPDQLVWSAGGHASDVVLTALADGQHAIVPPRVREHVHACATCSTHLGHAALLSMHVTSELRAKAEHEASLATRPFPWRALLGSVLVAAVGLLPSALDHELPGRALLTHDLPLFFDGALTFSKHVAIPGTSGVILNCAAAALLLVIGLVVARAVPKLQKEESR